jgi:hypothetical protein
MELCDFGTLKVYLKDHKSLDWKTKLEILRDISKGLKKN